MLYKLTADYRPNNPNKPVYYQFANSKKEAIKKWEDRFTWLKVYTCEPLDDETAADIVAHPELHIIAE